MAGIVQDVSLCTGCVACAQICAHEAVKMEENDEGFAYPRIYADKCIDCGLCRDICPVSNNNIAKISGHDTKVYACFSKDDDIRRMSSSGGVFTLLAENVLSGGGVVFGAEFDGNFRVRHNYVEKPDRLDTLRRSKYVQSDMGDMYKKAKAYLEEGRRVLFCGTPCQIAGLKAFLGRNHGNLLSCDMACHGVPSPKVWGMYLDFIENEYQSGIREISFRDKSKGWNNSAMKIVFNSGREYFKPVKSETFFIGFGKSIFNRRSCFNCRFRVRDTRADITLADFWGVEKLGCTDFCDNKGVSLVLVHTEAGNAAISAIKPGIRMMEQDFDDAVRGNPRLVSSCREPGARKRFFDDLNSGFTFDRLRRKYMDNFSLKYRLKCLAKNILHHK